MPTSNRDNVHLIDTKGKSVERVTDKGVVVDGFEHELYCLIFATGFEVCTSYARRAGYDVTGRDGQKRSDKWANRLKALHGFTTNGLPSCFFLGFTQAAVTVNAPHAINEQAKHIEAIMTEARDRGAKSVEASIEGELGW